MHQLRRNIASLWLTTLLLSGACAASLGADGPRSQKSSAKPPPPAVLDSTEGLKPIGGRWYVKEGKPPTYVFKDSDSYVDLFTYHCADSNDDGIPNLVIRLDDKAVTCTSA
jgi:hypothetical protein